MTEVPRVNVADPISLLFGGMAKLGPGADDETLQALHLLPQRRFDLIVDAGCGTGRQTIALARELGTSSTPLTPTGPTWTTWFASPETRRSMCTAWT